MESWSLSVRSTKVGAGLVTEPPSATISGFRPRDVAVGHFKSASLSVLFLVTACKVSGSALIQPAPELTAVGGPRFSVFQLASHQRATGLSYNSCAGALLPTPPTNTIALLLSGSPACLLTLS